MADVTMQQQEQHTTIHHSKQQKTTQDLSHHSHQALSSKRLLKLVLKAPHSSTPASPSSSINQQQPVEQADLVKPIRHTDQQADIVTSSSLKPTERGQEFNPSLLTRATPLGQSVADPAQPIKEEPELTRKSEEEVDLHHSRFKGLELQQVDEGAFLERPQRHQKQQEELHTAAAYPKQLRSAYQGQQEQGSSLLGSPKFWPQFTHSSLHALHGLHQSPHLASRSTSVSMQSSANSPSSTSASDEVQKPSKKRKLQSLLEPEIGDGQSVAADGAKSQLHVTSAMPAATSAADISLVLPSMEIVNTKEFMTANSPKGIIHDPQLIPTTRLLNHILDRLQKKDKFGVFAEPVDITEVPDYYDIIKDPMDFGTMRSRISCGHYTTIQLFQNDVFLICENAMQFNCKGTVYYRHARSIKDIAERILEELKVSGSSVELDESTTIFRSGGTGRSSEKQDSCVNSDTRLDNLDEFSGYFLRTRGSIDGKWSQGIDENRRSTYLSISTSFPGNDLLLTTISGDSSHLVPTGYQMEFPYSKSLIRFATDLGPLVWKRATEKIRKALPQGCPFGPGWVGERESGGVILAPSTKQPVVMQSACQQTSNLPSEDGAIATSDGGVSSAIQFNLNSQSHKDVGCRQDNYEAATKVEYQSGVQASAKLLNETRSLMVFGNSLVQNERPERRVLGQPAAQPITRLHTSDNSGPVCQGHSQAEKKFLVKFDQTSEIVGNKAKFAGQVNLNHPVSSLQPDREGSIVNNGVSSQGNVFNGRDALEGKALPGPGPRSTVIPVSDVGAFSFPLGCALNSRPPHIDGMNTVKTVSGEMGMITAARNHLDGSGTVQFRRLNPFNDSPSREAGSIITSSGKNDVMYQANSSHMSGGLFMPQNLNIAVQQPCGNSNMDTRDGNSFDPLHSTSSVSHSAQGYTLHCNSNTHVQQTAGSSQHFNSSNRVGSSRDGSPADQGLSTQPASLCPEQALGERFKEAGDLLRDKEMLNLAGRMATGAACTMPRKGLTSEQSITMQQLEPRNRQMSSHELVGATIHNLDQLNRKQNASAGFLAASFSCGLPTSHGASMVREVPGWRLAQQPDSMPVTEKGGIHEQNQVMQSPGERSEGNSDGVAFLRLQTLAIQDPQLSGFRSKSLVSSMPGFSQQQLGNDNIHGLPSQHQQVQLHVQGNSLFPGAQHLSPSNSGEANFVRQFQSPSHRGFAESGSPVWQYMPQQMVALGSHQSFAAAPDLNVSIALTKSPFDQPNGDEIQQPDLALQL